MLSDRQVLPVTINSISESSTAIAFCNMHARNTCRKDLQKKEAFKNYLVLNFVVIPLLVQQQLAVASQSALLNVRMTQLVWGSAGAGGAGFMPGAGGCWRWWCPGEMMMRWALSCLPLLSAQMAPAGLGELLEGLWDNLGIPAAWSSSSKPAFVPKHAGELLQAL